MIHALAQRLPFYYGWIIVGCATCSSIVRQVAAVATLSIFIVPMTGEFGWSRSGISGAVSAGAVLGALCAPFIGPLFDRHGSRVLLVASALAVSVCCIALAGTTGLLWFYVAFSISRMMFSTPFEIGTSSAVAQWFMHRRARAMSLLAMSAGIGLTILPLVAAAAIDLAGWRTAWLTLAAVAIVFGVLPQWFLLVRRPEDIGLRPDGAATSPAIPDAARAAPAREIDFTRSQALRTSTLWLMIGYTLLVFQVQAGVSLHQAPHLIERGLSPTIAATTVSTFSLTVAVASVLFGYLGDRIPVRMALASSAVLLALGSMSMRAVDGPLLGYASAVLFGAGIGGILTIVPVAWASYFGRAHFGAIRGITLPAQVGGQAIGPLAAGVLHDLTGSYANGLATFAVLSLLAAALALATRPPRRPR